LRKKRVSFYQQKHNKRSDGNALISSGAREMDRGQEKFDLAMRKWCLNDERSIKGSSSPARN